jgi:hypothetical protein
LADLPRVKLTRGTIHIALLFAMALPVVGQEPAPANLSAGDRETVMRLLQRLEADETRIRELEQKLNALSPQPADPAPKEPRTGPPAVLQIQAAQAIPAERLVEPVRGASDSTDPMNMHDHSMEIPGGPVLKFRGYTDINLGVGPLANPLIFPLGAAAHNSVQLGEFDLFMSSKLSQKLSFVSEMVIGPGRDNEWGLDLERVQLTYRASPFLEISGGRYHSAIGYYNTTFHHGTWFQTAEGRPLMYLFEDAGGLLPMHNIGVTATGLVPRTGKLNLRWVAEFGNGRASNLSAAPVQNLISDRNHKSVNLALSVRPEWLEGLLLGGNIYRDRQFPDGVRGVQQTISSMYAVYNNSNWEFLNEVVVLSNRDEVSRRTYNSPLMYAQVSRRFGEYRPYFRYQYLNSVAGDPLNQWQGRYEGPAVGVRYNVSQYAALKLQYSRLGVPAGLSSPYGVNMQMAFTF